MKISLWAARRGGGEGWGGGGVFTQNGYVRF